MTGQTNVEHLHFNCLVPAKKGITVESSDDESVIIKCGGGVVWHDLVLWAIEQGYGGIENLSLIPGTVGAAPIQNIGAYGVELKDVFIKLDGVRLATREHFTFTKKGCKFGYRDSIFKGRHKGEFIITQVYLKLSKKPIVNTSYGAIAKVLAEKGIDMPTIKDVSDAVIAIRQSKLPDPAVIGNAGSFFKNPVISKSSFDKVIAEHPDMPSYPQDDGQVKVPAGWLIEQCGWKGKQVGNTGAHKNQALVLVNYGDATGEEVLALSEEIIKSVFLKFGIGLSREVNVI